MNDRRSFLANINPSSINFEEVKKRLENKISLINEGVDIHIPNLSQEDIMKINLNKPKQSNAEANLFTKTTSLEEKTTITKNNVLQEQSNATKSNIDYVEKEIIPIIDEAINKTTNIAPLPLVQADDVEKKEAKAAQEQKKQEDALLKNNIKEISDGVKKQNQDTRAFFIENNKTMASILDKLANLNVGQRNAESFLNAFKSSSIKTEENYINKLDLTKAALENSLSLEVQKISDRLESSTNTLVLEGAKTHEKLVDNINSLLDEKLSVAVTQSIKNIFQEQILDLISISVEEAIAEQFERKEIKEDKNKLAEHKHVQILEKISDNAKDGWVKDLMQIKFMSNALNDHLGGIDDSKVQSITNQIGFAIEKQKLEIANNINIINNNLSSLKGDINEIKASADHADKKLSQLNRLSFEEQDVVTSIALRLDSIEQSQGELVKNMQNLLNQIKTSSFKDAYSLEKEDKEASIESFKNKKPNVQANLSYLNKQINAKIQK